MIFSIQWLVAHVTAYLLGSIPTALWVGYWLTKRDIREMGDGNMGARNMSHVVGWWPAALVAVVDVGKGMLAMRLGQAFGMEGLGLYTVGAAAVLGHDFPIFAGLRGGQGMATIVGVNLMLLPVECLIGLGVFGLVYLLTRRFNLSGSFGLGSLPLLAWVRGHPPDAVLFPVLMLLTIPLKKGIDRRRVPPMAVTELASNGGPPPPIQHNSHC